VTFEFAPLVTFVQRYVFIKLLDSTIFLFRENRMHETDVETNRQTDGVQRIMRPLRRAT